VTIPKTHKSYGTRDIRLTFSFWACANTLTVLLADTLGTVALDTDRRVLALDEDTRLVRVAISFTKISCQKVE
jgi:hypothetical protein